MNSLWDISKTTVSQREDELREENRFEEVVDEHREKFDSEFKEALKEDPAPHPYKIYRNIVESRELETEEKMVLEHLKDRYSDKWENQKRGEIEK